MRLKQMLTRKLLITPFCLLVAGTPFASTHHSACNELNPAVDDIAILKASGKLRVGLHEKEYPWSWKNNHGQWQGYDVDFSKALAKALNVTPKFITLHLHGTKAMLEMLKSDQFDIVLPEKPLKLDDRIIALCSTPYQIKHLGILVNHQRQTGPDTATIKKQIRKKTQALIGILNSAQEKEFIKKELPETYVIYYRTESALLNALKTRKVTAVIGNESVLSSWLSLNPAFHLNFRLFHLKNSSQPIYVVTSVKHWRLVQWLNVFITQELHNKNGLFAKLSRRYSLTQKRKI